MNLLIIVACLGQVQEPTKADPVPPGFQIVARWEKPDGEHVWFVKKEPVLFPRIRAFLHNRKLPFAQKLVAYRSRIYISGKFHDESVTYEVCDSK